MDISSNCTILADTRVNFTLLPLSSGAPVLRFSPCLTLDFPFVSVFIFIYIQASVYYSLHLGFLAHYNHHKIGSVTAPY